MGTQVGFVARRPNAIAAGQPSDRAKWAGKRGRQGASGSKAKMHAARDVAGVSNGHRTANEVAKNRIAERPRRDREDIHLEAAPWIDTEMTS
jgi:hypothetical protein